MTALLFYTVFVLPLIQYSCYCFPITKPGKFVGIAVTPTTPVIDAGGECLAMK